jgi:excisionase family DNA binding protein
LRPFLISLLEEKKLPFRLVGSHRRIRFADLQAFREVDDKQREAVLAELSADAQLNGHGY